jgi:Putative polyhydroxyalkanoic acid system protein (PHA_gran_rgn)
MELILPHALAPAEVRRRVRLAIVRYGERFARHSPEIDWKSQDVCAVRFKAKGVRIAVDVELRASAVVVRAKLPLVLAPFARTARGRIEAEAAAWLGQVGPASSADVTKLDHSSGGAPSQSSLRSR